MSTLNRRLVDALKERVKAKDDLLTFAAQVAKFQFEAGWFHRELSALLQAFLQDVLDKKSPRLILNVPPRHGKTFLTSVSFPAYVLGRHPTLDFILATYGQDLANDVGRDVRDVLQSPVFRDCFGTSCTLDRRTSAADYLQTEQGGSFRAVGVGGALVGLGAHILAIDDPVKNRVEAESELTRESTWGWYQTAAATRLAPGGGIVVIQQRWNQDDLTGRILTRATERANDGARQWRRVIYPAVATEDEPHRKKGEPLHPERYSAEMLNAMRAEMDPREWNALYQQNPTPDEGVFFKKEWINYYKPGSIPRSTLRHYVTADLAIGEKKTNDYTVVAVLGVSPDDIIYVMPDMVRERLDSFAIVEALLDQACQYDAAAIIIEREKTSMAIMPLLEKRMRERGRYFAVFDPSPTKDKAARASPLQGRMRQARVLFPDVRLFREVVEPEFLAFPLGKHDDITDAIATGVSELPKLTGGHRASPAKPAIADDEEPTPKNNRPFFAWQTKKAPVRPTVLRGK